MSKEELDLLDHYALGTLTPAEQSHFDERIKNDPSFRGQAEEHQLLLKTMKEYDARKKLKQSLNAINPTELSRSRRFSVPVSPGGLQKYWSTLAIAASVALVSVVGTLFMANWFDQKHQANYLELRRNVEKLKKSQTQILENIKEKKKNDLPPGKYSGSGFLISSDGYVVTSYHVVKAADSIYVENETFGKLKTSVVYSNPANDVALLLILNNEFNPTRAVPCTIRSKEGDIGESVYTLGFPREEIVYGEGSISAITGYDQNENTYQVSVPVNPGNSGGPMMDQQGALIGIINGIQTETRGAAFAIKSGVLLDAIRSIPADSLPRPMTLSSQNRLANMTRVNQIKRWKDFVFMVKVYYEK